MLKKYKKSDLVDGILFILPSFIGFSFFYLVPFFIGTYYVFTRSMFDNSFVGLNNFIELFNSESFRRALLNTLKFTFISVPLIIIISLTIAVLLVRSQKINNYLNIYLLPLVIPVGSVVLVWQLFFDKAGTLNYFLKTFNLSTADWLESDYAIIVILLLFLWKNVGFNILLFFIGLNDIKKEYYEAAKIEGASSIAIFRRITMPFLVPTFFLSFVLCIINSFRIFKETYLLSGNYPHKSIYMLQHYMNNMFKQMDYSKLMSSAYVVVVILVVVVLVFMRVEKRMNIY